MKNALTQYRNHRGDLNKWLEYKRTRAHFRRQVTLAKTESWHKFTSSLNSNTPTTVIYNKIRRLCNTPSSKSYVLKENNLHVSDPLEICNILGQHFSRTSNGQYKDPVFTSHKTEREKTPIEFSNDNSPTYNNLFSYEEFQLALTTSNSRSPGPDNIPYDLIKHMSIPQQCKLLEFYNYVYKTGYPHQWREGSTVPICKPNKNPANKQSYRPITLLSCLSKLLDKMVTRRLQQHLETIKYFTPNQSGFRAGHSTIDAITRLEHHARTALLTKQYCVCVLLDISQAFDTVWHHGLLTKLHNIGISGRLAQYLQQFLKWRKIKVTISSNSSPMYPLHSGVPQGAVSSPTLFSILINDIFANTPPEVHTSLYADDGALWTTSPTLPQALERMQEALNQVHTWSQHWGLAISAQKTTALIITNRAIHSPPHLLIGTESISYCNHAKFLGLTFDSHLTWQQHITTLHNRCRKDIRLLKIISGHKWGADMTTLRRLYTSLIVPKLSYGCLLFDTAAKTHLAKLDRIQNEAMRTILGALKCTPTIKLCAETNILPLKHRRQLTMLQYGYRILSIPQHPTADILTADDHLPAHLASRYKLPCLTRLKLALNSATYPIQPPPPIPLSERYPTTSIPALCSLAKHPKSTTTYREWQILFNQLCTSKYQNHQHIYTDGTSSTDGNGSAVWCTAFTLISKLPKTATVFTTELYAIYSAIKYVTNKPGSYVIFTDSLSAIHALQSLHSPTHYLTTWIRSALSTLTLVNIIVEWVPGHTGIPGNELADTLARSSLALSTTNSIPPSSSEVRHCVRTRCRAEWTREWQQMPLTVTNFKPELGEPAYANLPRLQQVPLTRLRLATSRLSHEHLYRRQPAPNCPQCSTPITHNHFLIECPAYARQRRTLIAACTARNQTFTLHSILQPTFPAQHLIHFLTETALLQKL